MLENAVLTFRPVSQLQALLLLTPDSLSRRAHGRSDSPAHTPFYRNHRRTSATQKRHASTLKRGMGSRDGKTNGKTNKQNLNITLPDKCHVVPRSDLSGVPHSEISGLLEDQIVTQGKKIVWQSVRENLPQHLRSALLPSGVTRGIPERWLWHRFFASERFCISNLSRAQEGQQTLPNWAQDAVPSTARRY